MPAPDSRTSARPSPLRRVTALVCAAVVWLLGLLAVSPQLHAEVHDHCCEPQHACVITWFSQGAENPLPATPEVTVPLRVVEAHLGRGHDVCLPAPAYRLRPGRGPPAC